MRYQPVVIEVVMLIGAACAKQDLNLQDSVAKNLRWIRPPADYTRLPVDMDDYYSQDMPDFRELPDVHRLTSALKPRKKKASALGNEMSDSESLSSYSSSEDTYVRNPVKPYRPQSFTFSTKDLKK